MIMINFSILLVLFCVRANAFPLRVSQDHPNDVRKESSEMQPLSDEFNRLVDGKTNNEIETVVMKDTLLETEGKKINGKDERSNERSDNDGGLGTTDNLKTKEDVVGTENKRQQEIERVVEQTGIIAFSLFSGTHNLAWF